MRSARTIASDWHGGQWSDLYRYASSGNYDRGILWEIRRTYNATPRYDRWKRGHRELRWLYYHLLGELKAIRTDATTKRLATLAEGKRYYPYPFSADFDTLWGFTL